MVRPFALARGGAVGIVEHLGAGDDHGLALVLVGDGDLVAREALEDDIP
jgi:hypothetical protein